MDIPKDKSYPKDSVQCDSCGGHGCGACSQRGWVTPRWNPKGRECANRKCKRPLKPNCIAVYCSNKCAREDA